LLVRGLSAALALFAAHASLSRRALVVLSSFARINITMVVRRSIGSLSNELDV